MMTMTSVEARTGSVPPFLRRLGRDYAYVLPGFLTSLLAFVVLIPMFALGAGTLVIWLGAVLLPLTLLIGSGFAGLSRARLRVWGRALPAPRYRERSPGVSGLLGLLADPRRWLDLLFETLIAFPLRTASFTLAVSWTGVALGGVTYWLWGHAIPDDEYQGLGHLLLGALHALGLLPGMESNYLAESLVNLMTGAVFLVTLPFVMRGLALLDATVTTAALGSPAGGSGRDGDPVVIRTERAAGTGDPVPREWSADAWTWLAAAVVAVVLLAVGWPVLAAVYAVPVAVAMLLALAHSGALLLAVRQPMAAVALGTAAGLGGALASYPVTGLPWPWPVPAMLAQLVVMVLVALRAPWGLALAAWALPAAGSFLFMPFLPGSRVDGALANVIVFASVGAVVAVVGALLRLWLLSRGALVAERRVGAAQEAKRRELEERNRIARELHDVVAHSMSVISVQAATAQYRLPGVDERIAGEFDSIAGSARQALGEMRALLALLRGADRAPLAPQPHLGDLAGLIESTRQSGARIEFTETAAQGQDPAAIPPATGVTAYRIVQEGLSNALRHAPGAAVRVRVDLDGEYLRIVVANGPVRAEDSARTGAAGGAGLGLAGLRERAEALGGSLEAGPEPGGGFTLRAQLPAG